MQIQSILKIQNIRVNQENIEPRSSGVSNTHLSSRLTRISYYGIDFWKLKFKVWLECSREDLAWRQLPFLMWSFKWYDDVKPPRVSLQHDLLSSSPSSLPLLPLPSPSPFLPGSSFSPFLPPSLFTTVLGRWEWDTPSWIFELVVEDCDYSESHSSCCACAEFICLWGRIVSHKRMLGMQLIYPVYSSEPPTPRESATLGIELRIRIKIHNI